MKRNTTKQNINWASLLNPQRRKQSRIKGDKRSQIERDFDRTIFSTPVRRLKDKAQVFPLDTHDSVRTRLTHSYEVINLARSMGFQIGQYLKENRKIKDETDLRSIEFVCMTSALVHDLGNPPFGHAGEAAIQDWIKKKIKGEDPKFKSLEPNELSDFENFDGNPQTFRLISSLQVLDNEYGLNLTFASLATSLKYTVSSTEINKENCWSKKLGYFESEREIVKDVWNATGLNPNRRHPLTYLVEAADDIAYATIDLEDGLKKGCISWDHLKKLADNNEQFKEIVSKADKMLNKDFFSDSSPENCQDALAVHMRTAAIGLFIPAALKAFKENLPAIETGTLKDPLVDVSEQAEAINFAKNISRKYIFTQKDIIKLELRGRKIISDLLDFYWEAACSEDFEELLNNPKTKSFHGKIISTMSSNYRDFLIFSLNKKKINLTPYKRIQLVIDYVCGMTDSFAQNLHKELFNGL